MSPELDVDAIKSFEIAKDYKFLKTKDHLVYADAVVQDGPFELIHFHKDIAEEEVPGENILDGGKLRSWGNTLDIYGNATTIGIETSEGAEREDTVLRIRKMLVGTGIKVVNRS